MRFYEEQQLVGEVEGDLNSWRAFSSLMAPRIITWLQHVFLRATLKKDGSTHLHQYEVKVSW